MPFAMDSTDYTPEEGGAWRLFQFRMPQLVGGGPGDEFLAYLRRPEVKQVLQDINVNEDFGAPGDYIYKRMHVPAAELPAPFNRLSTATLDRIKSIYRYNADSTMNIFLKEPYDEEGNFQKVYEHLKQEIEQAPR